jgi:hypothetical protein
VKLVKLTEHDNVSRETVRRRLAENDLKPWRKDMWCIPQVDAEYVARIEDVLDLYAEEPDPKRPVVCFDESPTQLTGEVRRPSEARSGVITANTSAMERPICSSSSTYRSWRKVKVTDSRAAVDFAACMRELTNVHFTKAERIRVVLDNLSTHSAGALYQAFPAAGREACCAGCNSTTFPNTPAGSIWSRSRSVYCEANAWTGAFPPKSASYPRSPPGNDSVMLRELASNGCSPPQKHAPRWGVPTPSPLPSANPAPKSHNHCAEVLGRI